MRDHDVEKIAASLAPGFESDLFRAALRNLDDLENPLRFNNFAYAARELVDQTLERLAPAPNVKGCPWYTQETNLNGGVSRRQRAWYAIQGGLIDEYLAESLDLDTRSIHSSLAATLRELNKHTHVGPETFDRPAADVSHLVDQTLAAIAGLLITIEDCRNRVHGRLASSIDTAAVEEVLRETVMAIDEIAPHHSIQNVSVGLTKLLGIDEEYVHFEATGSISCILQWGSNSDVRRGDGLELPQSFPFSCELRSAVAEPDEIETVEDSLRVDTGNWVDVMYGRDEFA